MTKEKSSTFLFLQHACSSMTFTKLALEYVM